MALREIAPSKAIYALHHGKEEKNSFYTVRNLWAVRRYRDPETNTQILAWRSSLDKNIVIVAVAHAVSDFVEPAPGQDGLTFYRKNKELRKQFYAQEKDGDVSTGAAEEKPSAEITKAPAPEPPEPEDPEEPEDEEKNEVTRKSFEKQSSSQLQKSKRTHQKLIREHVEKLKAYRQNPEAQDNKGLLRNAETIDKRNAIFNGRQTELRSQIRSQRMRLRVICDILKDRGIV